jgi:hypothetical protein
MKVVPMERNTIRRCAALVDENHPEFGTHRVECRNSATAWVETAWVSARRVASLNGSTTARFTRRDAVCDAHATAAVARVELLTK